MRRKQRRVDHQTTDIQSAPDNALSCSKPGVFEKLDAVEPNTLEKLKENELRLRTILDSIQIGIIIIEAKEHIIIDVNPVAMEMIGLQKDDIIGRVCHRFICPAECGMCPITDKKQTIDRSERILINNEGKQIPIFKTVKELMLNGRVCLIESVIDISDRKKAEEQIQQMNNELEQRVSQRTNELEKTNQSLKESMEQLKNTQDQLIEKEKLAALGKLVAGIAHEINTPVGISVTAASQLLEKTEDFTKLFHSQTMKRSDLEKYVTLCSEITKSVLSNLQRASNLIKSFKQVSVDQSSEGLRTFQVREYIDEVLLSLKPKFKQTRHSVTVNCPDDIIITHYAGAFSQILTNLIMNSLIHGFEHIDQGLITINISRHEQMLTIRYTDNGKGLDTIAKKNLFYPFFTTKCGSGGSGLGMHIIYSLVTQKMHGHIQCTSEPHQGIEFLIHIPLTCPADSTQKETGTVPGADSNKR